MNAAQQAKSAAFHCPGSSRVDVLNGGNEVCAHQCSVCLALTAYLCLHCRDIVEADGKHEKQCLATPKNRRAVELIRDVLGDSRDDISVTHAKDRLKATGFGVWSAERIRAAADRPQKAGPR